MYGDFLVPTNTNVNNAMTTDTGTNWELIYEFTFEDSHKEAFEFPMDLDGNPLNLNGVKVVAEYPAGKAVTAKTVALYINEQLCIYQNENSATASAITATNYSDITAIIKNGVINATNHNKSTFHSPSVLYTNGGMLETDSITSFKIILPYNQVFDEGEILKFYVLRGV